MIVTWKCKLILNLEGDLAPLLKERGWGEVKQKHELAYSFLLSRLNNMVKK